MADYECVRKNSCPIRLDAENQLDSIIENMFDGIPIKPMVPYGLQPSVSVCRTPPLSANAGGIRLPVI